MKMNIGGQKVDSPDSKTIEVINPATQELIDTVPSATKEDMEKCLGIAQEGKRIWASTPLYERARILNKYADAVEEHKEELAKLQCREMGKIIGECEFEIGAAAKIFRGFIERANHLYGETLPDNQGGIEGDIIFTRREPLGVIACVVPFNYPVELYAHKVAPALITGNAVIVKPASDNPLVVIRLVELLIECGVPGSVAQVITGRGSVVGEYLIPSFKIDAVSLTGSTEVGIDVMMKSAQALHRVFLELGGNDALIVFEDADLELAVDEAFAGRIQNAGQTCCACKRFVVHGSIKDKFTNMLVEKLSRLVKGDPMDRNTQIGCLINEKAAKEVEEQVNFTVKQGAKCIYGGKRYNYAFYEPAVLSGVTADMDIAKDMEVFGPVFPIIGFELAEEALAIANNTKYGLAGGVITRDINRALKTASKMNCGTVVINGSGCYRHMDHAFGGYKMSGLGREGISTTLEEMTQVKSYVLKGILR